jgi:dTDP-glucose pyrophosphorylase/CBS domain-containing protein
MHDGEPGKAEDETMNAVDRSDRLAKVIVTPGITIREAVAALDKSGFGILLLCEDGLKLKAVLTDGDVRRAILKNVSFDLPCVSIANTNPATAKGPLSPAQAVAYMDRTKSFYVNQLPVLDAEGRVVDLMLRRDLAVPRCADLSAVIMAGGYGKRLMPLTESVPKPLLRVGDRPIMEHIVDRLRDAGISKVAVSTHYLKEKIEEHFGDGSRFGVDMCYVTEDKPLGTAGALGLMEPPKGPVLVVNGDILTKIDFQNMFDYHREQKAELTVAVRKYEMQVPFGIVECDGARITGLREKPNYSFLVNAGIYLLEPSAFVHITGGERIDMTDLIVRLIGAKRPVASYPIVEYWLDVGRPDDFAKAQDDAANVTKGKGGAQ